MTLRDCPDCEQGKHATCLVEVWDDSADEWTVCPCLGRLHVPLPPIMLHGVDDE
jgi:hypothetical protein